MSDIDAAQQKLSDALGRLETAVESWRKSSAAKASDAAAAAERMARLEAENARLAALAAEAGERLEAAISRINQALAGGA
ncbi:MAG: hypothetical protein RIE31_06395 [Alphaproteobacteria bacterium]